MPSATLVSKLMQGIANPRLKLAQSYFRFRENPIATEFEPAIKCSQSTRPPIGDNILITPVLV